MKFKKPFFVASSVVIFAAVAMMASANHSWGGFHWARTSNPFTLKLGDNVSSAWDGHLATASADWSLSSVLNTAIVPGNGKRNCSPTPGRVEVCNRKYGNNGWLGIAQVWVSGNHITQAVTKMNDTYFSTPTYNTQAWKNFVLCQEIGHTFGLDHQDENFGNPNLGSCMDYTNSPSTNQHPNAHDYEQLESIYAHLDPTNTVFTAIQNGNHQPDEFENPSEWGKSLREDGHGQGILFERDLGNGKKLFTFVIWAKQ